MKNLIARFVKDESGATAIEYGLIAAGISLAIIAVVNGLGTNLNTKFTSINNSLSQKSGFSRIIGTDLKSRSRGALRSSSLSSARAAPGGPFGSECSACAGDDAASIKAAAMTAGVIAGPRRRRRVLVRAVARRI